MQTSNRKVTYVVLVTVLCVCAIAAVILFLRQRSSSSVSERQERQEPAKIDSKEPVIPEYKIKFRKEGVVPDKVYLMKGTRVIWVNNDVSNHQIAFDAPRSFKSKVLKPGESADYTFGEVGKFDYHCSLETD